MLPLGHPMFSATLQGLTVGSRKPPPADFESAGLFLSLCNTVLTRSREPNLQICIVGDRWLKN